MFMYLAFKIYKPITGNISCFKNNSSEVIQEECKTFQTEVSVFWGVDSTNKNRNKVHHSIE
jgi:hypothetical protein